MRPDRDRPILALDAMGVLYAAADDVAELLVPFVQVRGGAAKDEVERAYQAASLGAIDARAFWARVGLDPAVEDEYLAGHRLAAGVLELLAGAGERYRQVCCVTNDVSRWSLKLRLAFELGWAIEPWVVSGTVGARKPSPAIYRHLLERLGAPAREVVLVEGRRANLDAAAELGFRTVLHDPSGAASPGPHLRVRRLEELLALDHGG